MKYCTSLLSGYLSADGGGSCWARQMWRCDSTENVLVVGVPFVGADPGHVETFLWDGASWTHRQKLKPSLEENCNCFGFQVAVDGSAVVASAPYCAGEQGEAYVYRWNGSLWTEEQKLAASDGAANAFFGSAVDIEGNLVVVGAERAGGRGAAYVYRWNGSSWTEEQTVTTRDRACGQEFGHAVAVHGEEIIVGAPFEGDQGAAYAFRRSGERWVVAQKLTAPDALPVEGFARHVAFTLDDLGLVIGASRRNENGTDTDLAYIFQQSGDVWAPTATLCSDIGTARNCH